MYATQSYFARSYFGGIWGGVVEEGVIRPSSFVQNVLFGTPELQRQILPAGFEHAVAFGLPEIQLEVVSAGIVQNIEFGTPELQLQVRATGIDQLVGFGTPGIELEIRATGIEQFIQFGTPDIQLEVLEQAIQPAGVEHLFEFGQPHIQLEFIQIQPLGINQGIEFGIPRVYSPEYLTFNINLVPTEEFAQINTRRARAPVKFEQLIEQTEKLLAKQGIGETEMARTIKVTLQQSNTGQLIASQAVTVQSQAVPARGRLEDLADVDATDEVEGGVPVYHSANNTYVTERLDFGDIGEGIDEIDGGTF